MTTERKQLKYLLLQQLNNMRHFFGILFLIFIISCNPNTNDRDESISLPPTGIPAPLTIPFTIVAQHPHDTSAYTQGLEMHNGLLYESTGDYATSSLRITDWKTGQVKEKYMMGSDKIFGEGITIFKNKIYQLTWQNNIVYVYNLENIQKPVKTFKWPNEGWGITHDTSRLIVSDGTANLFFIDPENFRVLNTISVMDNKGPVTELNELEYINGFIFANVYTTNDILKIDPENGHVVGKMTLDNLLNQSEFVEGRTNVLNGIAYDSTTNTVLITGKRWPKLFELKLN